MASVQSGRIQQQIDATRLDHAGGPLSVSFWGERFLVVRGIDAPDALGLRITLHRDAEASVMNCEQTRWLFASENTAAACHNAIFMLTTGLATY